MDYLIAIFYTLDQDRILIATTEEGDFNLNKVKSDFNPRAGSIVREVVACSPYEAADVLGINAASRNFQMDANDPLSVKFSSVLCSHINYDAFKEKSAKVVEIDLSLSTTDTASSSPLSVYRDTKIVGLPLFKYFIERPNMNEVLAVFLSERLATAVRNSVTGLMTPMPKY